MEAHKNSVDEEGRMYVYVVSGSVGTLSAKMQSGRKRVVRF